MDLIILLLVIGIIGFLCYLIITYIPMPQPFQTVIMFLAAIFIILYVIRTLGVNLPNVIR